VVGAIVALGGVAMLALPSRKTFAFSRTERVFIIAKERFGRVQRQTILLRDIIDVSLEESTSSESGSTYRVAMTLSDQRRIPWTSYYTGGMVSMRVVVERVREFLALAPSPAPGSGALTASDERDARRGRILLVFMGAFCCLFLGIGATMLAKEQRRLSVFQPVTSPGFSVSSARVPVRRSRRCTSKTSRLRRFIITSARSGCLGLRSTSEAFTPTKGVRSLPCSVSRSTP
jgi:hypothetical protein